MLTKGLVNVLELWSALTGIGIFLNAISSKSFKKDLANFLALGRKTTGSVTSYSNLSKQFIENTLFRFFGQNPLTWQAFGRSMLVSTTCFACLLAIGYMRSSTSFGNTVEPFTKMVQDSWVMSVIFFSAILLLDYLSFRQTFLFMKYASGTNSLAELFFIAYCDIILTLNILVFIFPVCAVAYLASTLLPSFGSISYIQLEPLKDKKYFIENLQRHTPYYFGPLFVNEDLLTGSFDHIGLPGIGVISPCYVGEKEEDKKIEEATLLNFNHAIVNIAFTFRYSGLTLHQAEQLIQAHIDRIYTTRDSVLFGSKSDALNRVTTNNNGGFFLKRIVTNHISTRNLFSSKVVGAYAGGMSISQAYQLQLPEIIWSQPTYMSISIDNALGFWISNILWIDKGSLDSSKTVSVDTNGEQYSFTDICDDHVDVGILQESRRCARRVVVDSSWDAFKTLTDSQRLSEQTIPFYSAFSASFCFTVLFYISMILFLCMAVSVRGMANILPKLLLKYLDLEVFTENSLAITFSAGSLVLSVILVL